MEKVLQISRHRKVEEEVNVHFSIRIDRTNIYNKKTMCKKLVLNTETNHFDIFEIQSQ